MLSARRKEDLGLGRYLGRCGYVLLESIDGVEVDAISVEALARMSDRNLQRHSRGPLLAAYPAATRCWRRVNPEEW